MNTSEKLVDLLKEKLEIKSDKEAAEKIPNMNKQNLHAIRKGERHLTEDQALWIAEQCKMDCAIVLVELAEEKSKSLVAQNIWHELAKKLKATAKVMAVAGFLLVSSVSGQYQAQRT